MTRFQTLSRSWKDPRKERTLRRVLSGVGLALVVAIGLGLVVQHRAEEKAAFRLRAGIPSSAEGFASALAQSLGVETRPGHDLRFVGNGAVFDALADDIRHASESVHVDIFIWQKGEASSKLLSAIEQRPKGVECRVLADDAGSPGFEEDIAPRLRVAGCDARLFRPKIGTEDEVARNHRKIVVVDGRIAYTGGFGIRDEWLGDGHTDEAWRDENVRFTGPAVRDAQQAIAENWQEAGGGLLPAKSFVSYDGAYRAEGVRAAFLGSTAHPIVSRAERLMQLVFTAATRRLWIANAYFVPPEPILDILKEKARAGVDVRLLVPGKKSDSRLSMGSQHMEYGSLTEAGVRAFEYVPSMMHAKTVVVDDELAVIGTINLEPLSMSKLDEDALVVQDRGVVAEMARRYEEDCGRSKPVVP